ncbi:MAG: LytTR family DNA-binding domain-containing protein [Cypionkella sp.]
MSAVFKEVYQDFRSGMPIAIWAFFSVVLVITGPFGTYATMTLQRRALFWVPVMALAITASTAIRAYVTSVLGLTDFKRGSLAVTALVSLVCAPPLYALPFLCDDLPAVRPGLLEVAVLVASASLGICSIRKSLAADAPPEPAAVSPRIFQRLEPQAQGKLMSISVRDHYVEVRTCWGISNVLLRLSDAIAETDPEPGGQVHRSHWVAWHAIQRVEQDGAKTVLHLLDGTQLPVSRANLCKLEERGLL